MKRTAENAPRSGATGSYTQQTVQLFKSHSIIQVHVSMSATQFMSIARLLLYSAFCLAVVVSGFQFNTAGRKISYKFKTAALTTSSQVSIPHAHRLEQQPLSTALAMRVMARHVHSSFR
jgi:hypothetical protein